MRAKGRTWRGERRGEPIDGGPEEPTGGRQAEPTGGGRTGRKALAVILATLLTAAGFDLSAAAQTSAAPPPEGGPASPVATPSAPAQTAQVAPANPTGAQPYPAGTAAEPSPTPAAPQPASTSPTPVPAPVPATAGHTSSAAATLGPAPTPAVAGPSSTVPASEPAPTPAAQEPSPTHAAPEPSPAPAATQPSPALAAAEPDPPAPTCADPEILGTSLRCFPRLLVHDAAAVLGAPAHWRGRQWAIFSAEVAGVFALSFADKHIHIGVLPRVGHSAGRLAQDVEPLGGAASFGVLGAFYVAGAATGSEKAKGVAIDGLIASAIASGVISTGLKYAVGRSRPRAGLGSRHFRPFSGDVSFPSGHATQAFAVASVIATEYPSAWVQVAAYGPAALVGLARLRHDAHWASDVAAGALIGIGVGRAVARLDLPLRQGRSAYHLRVVPVVGPHEQGLMLAASFK
jgi:membrane-associated phospholipid phosphatase